MTDQATNDSATATDQPYKYRAFISYSHQDREWGDWLHKKLETYKPPKKLRRKDGGELPERIFPVFRDREELPTSADLGEVINQALRDSEHLVAICSPRSAQSIWVNEEIKFFKALGREDKVLALIVDGEPNGSDKPGMETQECFPQAMRFAVGPDGELAKKRTEAVAGDVRDVGDGKRNAFLKLVAGLLNVDYAKLNDREQKRRMRRVVSLGVAASLLVALFFGGWMLQERRRAQDLAVEQARTLEALEESRHQNGIALVEKSQAMEEQGNVVMALLLAGRALGLSSIADVDSAEYPAYLRDGSHEQGIAEAILWRNSRYMGNSTSVMLSQEDYFINQVNWSPDGSMIASAGDNIRIWDAVTGVLVSKIDLVMWSAAGIAWNSDSSIIAYGYMDEIYVCEVGSMEKVRVFHTQDESHFSGEVMWSPDDQFIAVNTFDCVIVWDVQSGEVVHILEADGGVAWSPDSTKLATGGGQHYSYLGYYLRNTSLNSGTGRFSIGCRGKYCLEPRWQPHRFRGRFQIMDLGR